jgi:hypothetical protein
VEGAVLGEPDGAPPLGALPEEPLLGDDGAEGCGSAGCVGGSAGGIAGCGGWPVPGM